MILPSWLRIVVCTVLHVDVFQVTKPFNESFEGYLDHTYNPHLDSMHRFNYRLLTFVRDMFKFR